MLQSKYSVRFNIGYQLVYLILVVELCVQNMAPENVQPGKLRIVQPGVKNINQLYPLWSHAGTVCSHGKLHECKNKTKCRLYCFKTQTNSDDFLESEWLVILSERSLPGIEILIEKL